MKIFILSDTHDRISKIPGIKNAILVHNPDLIIHLGDIISPFYINLLFNDLRKEKLKDKRIILLKGNNDGDIELIKSISDKLNIEFYTEYYKEKIYNKNIIAFHKPDFVESLAKSSDYDYIFYGHTHKSTIYKVNTTIIANPGTCSGYLSDKSTYLILNFENEKVEIFEL